MPEFSSSVFYYHACIDINYMKSVEYFSAHIRCLSKIILGITYVDSFVLTK